MVERYVTNIATSRSAPHVITTFSLSLSLSISLFPFLSLSFYHILPISFFLLLSFFFFFLPFSLSLNRSLSLYLRCTLRFFVSNSGEQRCNKKVSHYPVLKLFHIVFRLHLSLAPLLSPFSLHKKYGAYLGNFFLTLAIFRRITDNAGR